LAKEFGDLWRGLEVFAGVVHQPVESAVDNLFLIRDFFRGIPAE
jgi:hypothetical protein